MTLSIENKRVLFRSLHRAGCFVLARPRHIAGLRRIERLGAQAVEVSAGPELAQLCGDTALPVSVELQDTAHEDAGQWAARVRTAIEAGVAGLSVADRAGEGRVSYDSMTERLRLARALIAESGHDIVLQARCNGVGMAKQVVLQRLYAYAEAGADSLCLPEAADAGLIEAAAGAVSPRAVSVVIRDLAMDVTTLRGLGVRRISMGFTLGADAWSGFERGYAAVISGAVESARHASGRPIEVAR